MPHPGRSVFACRQRAAKATPTDAALRRWTCIAFERQDQRAFAVRQARERVAKPGKRALRLTDTAAAALPERANTTAAAKRGSSDLSLTTTSLIGERGITFDMSGMTRLAGACPLDGGVSRHFAYRSHCRPS
jgi:hypothetical protein